MLWPTVLTDAALNAAIDAMVEHDDYDDGVACCGPTTAHRSKTQQHQRAGAHACVVQIARALPRATVRRPVPVLPIRRSPARDCRAATMAPSIASHTDERV